jgi:hypothetical protein
MRSSCLRLQHLAAQLCCTPSSKPCLIPCKFFALSLLPPPPTLSLSSRPALCIPHTQWCAVAYLKGLLTAGEVVPAARQYRDRMLARVVVAALQRRVDAAAGDTRLPLGTGLQLVGNVAALRHVLPHLDEYLLAQARGESPATLAAAAAAAAAAASGGGGSPDRRGRSRSRSVSPSKLSAAGGKGGLERGRGQQQQEGVEPKDGDGLEDGQGSAPASAPAGGSRSVSPRPRSQSPGSSHGSAPSPEIAGGGAGPLPSQQLAAAAAVHQQHQQQSGSQQSGHTVLSFAASQGAIPSKPGEAAASSAATGSGAASLHAVLCSAEALVVQAAAAKAAGLLEAGEQLDWAPAEQQRSTAYSPYIEELIMHLKVSERVGGRMASAGCSAAERAYCMLCPARCCACLASLPLAPLASWAVSSSAKRAVCESASFPLPLTLAPPTGDCQPAEARGPQRLCGANPAGAAEIRC